MAAAAGSAALGTSGLDAAAYLIDGPGGDGWAQGGGRAQPGTIFASFVTDVHIDARPTAQDNHLQLVLADMRALNVPLMLHGGDVTEFGSNTEYDRYLQLLGADAPAEVQHVAGNHEVRWDATGGNLYRARLHPEGSRSFEHQRVHVVMLEVAHPLQEEAHVSRAALDWLREDLRRAGHRPSILVMHCPPGADFHYVRGTDELFALIADHPVKAILCGHTHRESITRVNGTIVLTGRACKNEPVHYLLRHSPTTEHDQLTVEAVSLPAPGDDAERTVTPLVTIRLDTERAGAQDALPRRLSARAPGQELSIQAHIGAPGAVIGASAQLRDEGQYGRTEHGLWHDLTIDGTALAAAPPLAQLAPRPLPGPHRLRVRTTAADGGTWEAAHSMVLPGGTVRELDRFAVEGAVTGALALTADDTVLVPTDAGEVVALALRGSRLRRRWRAATGPVHRAPALSADGTVAYVPSLDRSLVALDTRRGGELWRADLPERVASSPCVSIAEDGETVLVAAGPTLSRIGPDGTVVWTAPIPVQSCGRPLVVGDTVVIGAGDGTARAYALGVGAERWSAVLARRSSAFQRLLYGPWTTTVRPVGADAVLVGTVDTLHCLEAADGAVRWSTPVAAMYTPPEILDDGRILVVQERGQVAVLDPATGAPTVIGETGQVSLDAGIAPVPRAAAAAPPPLVGAPAPPGPAPDAPVVAPGTVPAAGTTVRWHVGAGGVLSRIDLAAATVTPLAQVTTSRVISTPVLLAQRPVLVVGDQDGGVRALDLTGT